ncbi:isochorismatase family protein [Streptomyces sp. NPDC047928]|uniref:isochorismatase family protein n=1 Tax=unclassified Streptomyces TaxID=2593676 RepID=UPI00371621E0
MAIPPIAPYALPGASELPGNKVSWTPDPDRAVLLVHDMQRYFVAPFAAGASPLTELIGNIRRLRETAADLGVPVVYTAQPGGMTRDQRGLLHDFWGPGMSVDPGNRDIVDELAPAPGDTVLTKWRYSAFHRTGLTELLAEQGRDQVVICGVYAHIGCLVTACDAFAMDVQPFLVADALADFSRDEHLMALRYAASRCAVTAVTDTVLTALRARTVQRV